MAESSSIITFLIAFGTCQAFFIAVVILKSGDKSLFKKLFAAFLLIEGIILFERLSFETGFIETIPHLLGISYALSFLKPPLILLMALALTVKEFRVRKAHYLHAIPFVLIALSNIPFFAMDATTKLETTKAFMQYVPAYSSFQFYFILSFFVYIGIYIVLAIRKLKSLRQQVKNNALANWYLTILWIYSAFLFIHLSYFVLQPIGNYKFPFENQVGMLITSFIIQSIAYKLFVKSTALKNKVPDLSDLQKRQEDEKLILDQFEIEKVHLDDKMSLQLFAEGVNLPAAYVSEIVNQKFNCSFKKLMAQYRLQEAKSIIANTPESDIKLIDIAYDSGFNNKVSFYRTFKELEGIPPSDYVRKMKDSTEK